MSTLYTISGDVATIEAMIDANDGEITDEVQQRINALGEQMVAKADGWASWIKNLKAEEEMCAAEAKHFSARKQRAEKTWRWVAGALIRTLETCGMDKVQGKFKLAIRQASRPSIRWGGEPATIPSKYAKIKVELDGDAAYNDWKTGKLPEGFIVTTSQWLDIK